MFQTIETVSSYFMNGKTHHTTLVAADPVEPQSYLDYFSFSKRGSTTNNDDESDPLNDDNESFYQSDNEEEVEEPSESLCKIPFLVNSRDKIKNLLNKWMEQLNFAPLSYELEPIRIEYLHVPYYLYTVKTDSTWEYTTDTCEKPLLGSEERKYYVIVPANNVTDYNLVKDLITNFGYFTQNTTMRRLFNEKEVDSISDSYKVQKHLDIQEFPPNASSEDTWQKYEDWFNKSHEYMYNEEFKNRKYRVAEFKFKIVGQKKTTLYKLPIIRIGYKHDSKEYNALMSGFNGVTSGERPYGMGFVKNLPSSMFSYTLSFFQK